MEKHESEKNSNSALDFFGDDRWPNELRLLVVQHLSPTDLIVCRVVCKIWLNNLRNEFYWEIKIPPTLKNYVADFKGNYFRMFTRGGVHLVQTIEHLKKYLVSEPKYIGIFNKASVDANLSFLYVQTKIKHYYAESMEVIRKFMNEIVTFNCPYLAIPTKYFEDEEYFYMVFDNEYESLLDYFSTIPAEEYNEKLIVRLIQQVIHAMKYLHERNLFLVTCFGTLHLGMKRSINGKICLQLANYMHNWYAIYAPIIYPGHLLSPDIVHENPTLTVSSDLFSLGILTKFLLTGTYLYDIHPMRAMFEMRKFQSYEIKDPNNELSDLAKDFILRLLKRNPEDRMTLEEALNHPWLTNPEPSTSPLTAAYAIFTTDDISQSDDEK